ncbi:unnamed protein product [Acanthoscelides obtectus]|uniref:Uncharacterized protein n=1 Tax=Acanthoscelides obtectus TaxID=200917 RepID=A0A9P0P807_ACAOB|nr:unnamed protein product [Acanthoscelides obtectus]CAK1679997.1 hypothetical protein AOBTE_LOCUS32483 [Acanthoscelides obtectus]
MSLVKDIKKIHEHLQMHAKLDILRVIKDAQQVCYYSNSSWGISRAHTSHGYQTAHYSYSRNNPQEPTHSMDAGRPPRNMDVGRPPSHNMDVQSPILTLTFLILLRTQNDSTV